MVDAGHASVSTGASRAVSPARHGRRVADPDFTAPWTVTLPNA